jgi:hypothetical protein
MPAPTNAVIALLEELLGCLTQLVQELETGKATCTLELQNRLHNAAQTYQQSKING